VESQAGATVWFRGDTASDGFQAKRVVRVGPPILRVSLSLADLDGDGDLDIVQATDVDGLVTWLPNLGHAEAFGPARVLVSAADSPERRVEVHVADLDGVHGPDLVVTTRLGT